MLISVVVTTLLAILLFGLGLYVSLLRIRTKTLSYFAVPSRGETQTPLARAQRAFGNTAEYVPMLVLLVLLAGGQPTVETWWEWCMIIIVITRYVGAAGFVFGSALDQSSITRATCALLTYATGIALAIGIALPYLQDMTG